MVEVAGGRTAVLSAMTSSGHTDDEYVAASARIGAEHETAGEGGESRKREIGAEHVERASAPG